MPCDWSVTHFCFRKDNSISPCTLWADFYTPDNEFNSFSFVILFLIAFLSFCSINCFVIRSRWAPLYCMMMILCPLWQFFSQSLEHWKALFILLLLSLLFQIVSHVSTFASLLVIGSWLAAALFAVCMASVPEATNPLRYSLLHSGHAALPRP